MVPVFGSRIGISFTQGRLQSRGGMHRLCRAACAVLYLDCLSDTPAPISPRVDADWKHALPPQSRNTGTGGRQETRAWEGHPPHAIPEGTTLQNRNFEGDSLCPASSLFAAPCRFAGKTRAVTYPFRRERQLKGDTPASRYDGKAMVCNFQVYY